MPLVEQRYAEALVDICTGDDELKAFEDELKKIVDIFNGQEDFKLLLLNPQIKLEIKKEIIKNVFYGKIRKELLNLLLLLLDKGRLKLLPGVLNEYIRLADQKKGVLNITIISSIPLSETQINTIKEKYRVIYNASYVKANVEIDAALLGGVKVKIGDKVIDGTVKGRLESLRQLIVES